MSGSIGLALGLDHVPAGQLIAFVALAVVIHEARQAARACRAWLARRPSAVPLEAPAVSVASKVAATVGPAGRDAAPPAPSYDRVTLRAEAPGEAARVTMRPASTSRWGWMLLLLGVTLVLVGSRERRPATSRA